MDQELDRRLEHVRHATAIRELSGVRDRLIVLRAYLQQTRMQSIGGLLVLAGGFLLARQLHLGFVEGWRFEAELAIGAVLLSSGISIRMMLARITGKLDFELDHILRSIDVSKDFQNDIG